MAAALCLLAGCASSGSRPAASRSARAGSTSTSSTSTSSTTTSSTTPTTVAPTTTAPSTSTTTIARRPTAATRPVAAPSGSCPANLASHIANTRSAGQLVTVESSSYSTDVATVTLWQKTGSCWEPAAGPWSGFIGYNGFSDHKHEGDGTTPTGIYGFGPVIYGNRADPGVHEPYHQLVCGDWWDEDPASAEYNTFQHVTCGTTPSWSQGSEALWEEKQPYPSFAVIDYNTDPVVKGAGSGIFLHASTGGGTAGCVSVPLSDLDWFLRWMEPSQDPLIAMGPASEITRF